MEKKLALIITIASLGLLLSVSVIVYLFLRLHELHRHNDDISLYESGDTTNVHAGIH